MSKFTVFYLISPNFLSTFFGQLPFFPHMPNKDPPACIRPQKN